MIKTILIHPDLTVEEKINEFAYQDFHEIRDQKIIGSDDVDIQLPNNSFLHTITTKDGMYITIHKNLIKKIK